MINPCFCCRGAGWATHTAMHEHLSTLEMENKVYGDCKTHTSMYQAVVSRNICMMKTRTSELPNPDSVEGFVIIVYRTTMSSSSTSGHHLVSRTVHMLFAKNAKIIHCFAHHTHGPVVSDWMAPAIFDTFFNLIRTFRTVQIE